MTRVVNMRASRSLPEGTVYVGRAVPRRAIPDSPFHNPFVLADSSDSARAIALDQFRQYLRARPDLVAQVRRELAGKVLACWCAPKPCHADVLVAVADGGAP